MTTWTRARQNLFCGYCGDTIRKGEPLLELRLNGPRFKDGKQIGFVDVKRVLYRCSKFRCANEAVPEDLPPLAKASPVTPLPMTRFTPGMLPIDWKTRAGGEE